MKMDHKTIKSNEICPRFNKCSANICPLDPKAPERTYIFGEDRCPFMAENKSKTFQGKKIPLPDQYLKFVPEKNLKLLSKRSQKRWHALYKKVENEPNGNSNGNLFKN